MVSTERRRGGGRGGGVVELLAFACVCGMEGGKGRAMGLSPRERRKRVLVLIVARLCHLGGGESDAGEEEEEEGAEKVGSSRSGNSDGGSRRREQRRRRGTSSPSVRCLSSWWLPSRLFPRCKSLEEEGEMAKGEVVDGASSPLGSTSTGTRREASGGREAGEEEAVSSLVETTALRGAGWDRPVRSEEGWMPPPVGEKPEQTYLSIGMGAGLVFLLAKSVTEFNKMTELRSEMETLLKEMKGVEQKKDAGRRSSVDPRMISTTTDLACCNSVSYGGMEWSNELSMQEESSSHGPSLEFAEGSRAAEKGCNCREDEAAVGIDQMEEELKSELELLQLNLDKQEHSSEILRSFELPCGKSDACDYFDENSVVEAQYPEPGERPEEGAVDAGGRGCGGVSPQELMSRLHELVEARQRDRIAELESALQLAHIKLREKEMEACWWRDTARLVSQHAHEPVAAELISSSNMEKIPGIFCYKDEAYVIHLYRGIRLDDVINDVSSRWKVCVDKVELKCVVPERGSSIMRITNGEDIDRMIDMHITLGVKVMNVEVNIQGAEELICTRPYTLHSSGSNNHLLTLDGMPSQEGRRTDLWYDIIHSIGQTFNSVEHVRADLTKFAIARGYCSINQSHTERNPGRHFYKCKDIACEFFMWCDHLKHFVELGSSSSCCCEKELRIRSLEYRIAQLEGELKQKNNLLKKSKMIAKALPKAFSFLNIEVDEGGSDGEVEAFCNLCL